MVLKLASLRKTSIVAKHTNAQTRTLLAFKHEKILRFRYFSLKRANKPNTPNAKEIKFFQLLSIYPDIYIYLCETVFIWLKHGPQPSNDQTILNDAHILLVVKKSQESDYLARLSKVTPYNLIAFCRYQHFMTVTSVKTHWKFFNIASIDRSFSPINDGPSWITRINFPSISSNQKLWLIIVGTMSIESNDFADRMPIECW